MNRGLFLAWLCVLSPVPLRAQQFFISPMAEKTIVNYQLGSALQLQFKSGWRVGGFYQQAIAQAGEPADRYWGIAAAAPLLQSDRLAFYAATRAGLVNRYFFVVSPALFTSLKFSKRLSTDVGMSWRKGYLSAILSLNIHLGL